MLRMPVAPAAVPLPMTLMVPALEAVVKPAVPRVASGTPCWIARLPPRRETLRPSRIWLPTGVTTRVPSSTS